MFQIGKSQKNVKCAKGLFARNVILDLTLVICYLVHRFESFSFFLPSYLDINISFWSELWGEHKYDKALMRLTQMNNKNLVFWMLSKYFFVCLCSIIHVPYQLLCSFLYKCRLIFWNGFKRRQNYLQYFFNCI